MDDRKLSFNIELHTYVFWFINPNPNLRVSQQFLPPFAHISSYYFVSSIRLWNALPYTFVNCNDIGIFKLSCKVYMYRND